MALLSSAWRSYASFSGRMRRGSFWPLFAFALVVLAALAIIAPPLAVLVAMPLALPLAGAATRRMHDVGLSGRWLLPLVGIPLAMLAVLVLGNSMLVLILVAVVNPTVSDGDLSRAFIAAETMLAWALGICILASCVALAWQGAIGPNRFGKDTRDADPTGSTPT